MVDVKCRRQDTTLEFTRTDENRMPRYGDVTPVVSEVDEKQTHSADAHKLITGCGKEKLSETSEMVRKDTDDPNQGEF